MEQTAILLYGAPRGIVDSSNKLTLECLLDFDFINIHIVDVFWCCYIEDNNTESYYTKIITDYMEKFNVDYQISFRNKDEVRFSETYLNMLKKLKDYDRIILTRPDLTITSALNDRTGREQFNEFVRATRILEDRPDLFIPYDNRIDNEQGVVTASIDRTYEIIYTNRVALNAIIDTIELILHHKVTYDTDYPDIRTNIGEQWWFNIMNLISKAMFRIYAAPFVLHFNKKENT